MTTLTSKTGTLRPALFCLLAAVLWMAAARAATAAGTTLQLRDLEGRPRDLADFRGRVVVLNFWATWCLPCRREMPVLVEMQKRYLDRGVQVIAISTDGESTFAEIPRFVRRQRMSFPVWVGAGVEEMRRFGLDGTLPATVLVDRDGSIVEVLQGEVDREDLRQRLEWLLGDRSEPRPSPFAARNEQPPEDPHHEGEEEHGHGAAAMEGASVVPS